MSPTSYITFEELEATLASDLGRDLTKVERIIAHRFHITLLALAQLVDDLEACGYANSRAVKSAVDRAAVTAEVEAAS